MHSGQRSISYVLEKRKVKAIKMEVENVEFVRTLSNLRQHGEVSRKVPRELFVKPERYFAAGNEFRICLAIATREQHDLMTAVDQCVT